MRAAVDLPPVFSGGCRRPPALTSRGAQASLAAPATKPVQTRAHVLRRPGSARSSRPRDARGEPVPRPLAAGRLAARVRRPGDRPGAGCRGAHRRCQPPATFHARLLSPARRSQSADHLRRRSHPRRQELHHPARQRAPARQSDLLHAGVVSYRRAGPRTSGQDAGRAAAGRSAERNGNAEEHAADHARSGAALLRARAADRTAPGRVRTLSAARKSPTGASTSGSAPPAGCPTISRSINACWPMPPT